MSPEKNIRLIFFADTHLGFDFPIRPKIDIRRRGSDFFENFHAVLKFAVETQADLVLHGGDLFFRSKVPQKIVDLTYQALFDFAEQGIPLLIVPGNHERSILPVSLLLQHPNIYVFDVPKTYVLPTSNANIALSGFPFERENIKERVGTLVQETQWAANHADIRLLCLHQSIEGAQVGPSNFTFRYGKDVIKMRDLPTDFHAILSGHIHRRQILKKSGNPKTIPVIYPGSIERTSFAEKDEDKGFYDIEFSRDEQQQWNIANLKFQVLPTRPMVDLLLDHTLPPEYIQNFLRSQIFSLDKDAVVRLKSNGKIHASVKSMLTSAFLRHTFPKTMNVQLSSALRPFRSHQ